MADCVEDSVLLINEEADDDDDDDMLQAVSVQHEPHRAGIAPPLPPGKLYHAFFSHCREDEEWVRNLLDRLETPENGFRCCIADRDFDLGVPVFENICRSIQSSCKTVIVMSPDFLNSPWCSYEAQITMEQDIDLRRRLLVPIMLRQCAVPEFIGRLTYIDVNNEHFWARFIDALRDVEGGPVSVDYEDEIVEPAGSRARLLAKPFHFNPHYHNGQLITSLNAYRCCTVESELETNFIPDELISRGIHLNQQEYQLITRQLSKQWYLRCHFCGSSAALTITLVIFMLNFIMCVIGLSCAIFLEKPRNPNDLAFIAATAAGTIAVTLFMVLFACTIKAQFFMRYSRAMRDVNKTTSARNILVCSQDHGCGGCSANRVTASFYYYEWRSCELFLRDILADSEDLRERTADQVDARELLLDHSLEYGQLLVRRRLATPGEQRHNRQGECMCQFVERTLQETRGNRCLTWILNTPSRHPWKLLCFM